MRDPQERLTVNVVPVPLRLTVWGLPEASSVKVSVPVRVPVVDGVKVTLTQQLPPAGRLVPHVFVAKSPVADTLEIFSVVLPELLRFTIWEALVVPTFCGPNVKLMGERETAGPEPVPAIATVCGLFQALSPTVTAPARGPIAKGVNVTLIEQLAPPARLVPQLFVCAKSPLAATLDMLSVWSPVLVSVTVCAAMVGRRG